MHRNMRGAGGVEVVRSIHNYELFIILCFINSLVLGLSKISREKSSQPCGIVQKLKPIVADDFQLLAQKLLVHSTDSPALVMSGGLWDCCQDKLNTETKYWNHFAKWGMGLTWSQFTHCNVVLMDHVPYQSQKTITRLCFPIKIQVLLNTEY